MKLSKETNLKKQLVSGAVYTSLAVAVTAVAVGGITAAVGGGKTVYRQFLRYAEGASPVRFLNSLLK